ncbi:hypothetical protein CsSME_00007246 [Camellia sinensis var. sinensis]
MTGFEMVVRCDSGDNELGSRDKVPLAEEVSDWVLEQINDVNWLLGLSFEGHEDEALRLFSVVEASWR